MPRYIFLLFFILLQQVINAQTSPDAIQHSLFFIGDAGEPFLEESTIGTVLRKDIQSHKKATVVFLGDNVYPAGMPDVGDSDRPESERTLRTQVEWLHGLDVEGIFIPGNHDWLQGARKGWSQLTNQQAWIDSLYDSRITLLPRDGCPGPVEISLGEKATLVILDTQWFLHPWEKPGEDSECEANTTSDVLLLLNDIMSRNADKRVIVAAHHPMITYGNHGGVFTWKDHLFPLTALDSNLYIPFPVIGSFYPLYRSVLGDIQDTRHPLYKEMIEGLTEVLKQYPGTIFAAGHEHALQAIVKDSLYHIVSGAGVKTTKVKKKGYAKFASSITGYVRADILKDGKVEITFVQVDKQNPQGKIAFTDEVEPVEALTQPGEEVPDYTDKVVRIKASEQYKARKGKKKLLGDNYRSAWTQEIEVPVFDIGAEHGGLTIVQKGGGMQTLSLRLEDTTGRQYVLRSVEKFPEKAVPVMFRKTFVQALVQDQISASHPYAAIVIPPLATAAGIYHTNPKVVFIPDDPRLGVYRREFANTVALYEERPAGDWSDKPFFGNSSKIVNTSKVLEKVAKDNDNKVDEMFVLRCRLFDLWIGDWDRHDDQWRWATFEDKKGETFRPVPRDRDQAFFVNKGIIPKFWSRRWALPKFEGFDEQIRWPSGLSFNARYFDRSFLTEPDEEDWVDVARDLQSRLTDDVIEDAIRTWPKEIYDLHGEEITRKLKARRERLVDDARSHYQFLSRYVNIVGSDKTERVHVKRLPDGNVHVRMYKINKEGEQSRELYDRVFRRGETKGIHIYTRGGDDEVIVEGDARKSILLRIIGGDGKDTFVDSSQVAGLGRKTIVYDLKNSSTQIATQGETKNRTSTRQEVNTYDRMEFKYDRLAPLVYGNYNVDDGLFIGGGFYYQKEGFRKSPFKSRHIAIASVAPSTNSYNLLYRGDFTDVIGKWGIEIDADLKSPNYTNNFFGMGNETVFDKEIDEDPRFDLERPIDYYRLRFEEIRLETYAARRIGNYGRLRIGPALQVIQIEDPERDRYINEFAAAFPYNIYKDDNNYLGLSWGLDFEKKNHQTMPTRGVAFKLAGRNMAGLNDRANDLSSYETSLSLYQSFRIPAQVVFAARVGAGLNTGDYNFYQAQILDGKTELRGFRKTRFYGDRKFYTNLEMRVKLFRIRTYLFPASLGILGFHDLGRVWYKNEQGIDPSAPSGKSNAWHKGWGGGIWFTPFNLTVLSVEAGHSKEGTLAYVRLGFMF